MGPGPGPHAGPEPWSARSAAKGFGEAVFASDDHPGLLGLRENLAVEGATSGRRPGDLAWAVIRLRRGRSWSERREGFCSVGEAQYGWEKLGKTPSPNERLPTHAGTAVLIDSGGCPRFVGDC